MYTGVDLRAQSLTGTGKYFEVRYFLNVIVTSGHTSVSRFPVTDQADFLQ
jgi:hypothetical protein